MVPLYKFAKKIWRCTCTSLLLRRAPCHSHKERDGVGGATFLFAFLCRIFLARGYLDFCQPKML